MIHQFVKDTSKKEMDQLLCNHVIWFMDDGDPSLKKRLWNINNGFNGLFMVAIIQFISLIDIAERGIAQFFPE